MIQVGRHEQSLQVIQFLGHKCLGALWDVKMSSYPQCSFQSKTNINHILQVVEGHIYNAEQPFLNARLKCVSAVAFLSQEVLCLPFAKTHKSTITTLVHQHFSAFPAAEERIRSFQNLLMFSGLLKREPYKIYQNSSAKIQFPFLLFVCLVSYS